MAMVVYVCGQMTVPFVEEPILDAEPANNDDEMKLRAMLATEPPGLDESILALGRKVDLNLEVFQKYWERPGQRQKEKVDIPMTESDTSHYDEWVNSAGFSVAGMRHNIDQQTSNGLVRRIDNSNSPVFGVTYGVDKKKHHPELSQYWYGLRVDFGYDYKKKAELNIIKPIVTFELVGKNIHLAMVQFDD